MQGSGLSFVHGFVNGLEVGFYDGFEGLLVAAVTGLVYPARTERLVREGVIPAEILEGFHEGADRRSLGGLLLGSSL